MFDKLRQAHLHAHDWQQESLTFVPLRGTWFAQSEHSFDLEEEINKFLSSGKKILLLLGDSGSGKSLYTQGLASKLWQDHKSDSPIPVWISLPRLKNTVNRIIEETFEKFGFNTEQIESLKQKNSFIFIFDAFDEIHQLKNLWVSNHLDQWNAKIIITCRREYLYHVDNYKHFFTPFNGEKALYLEYDEMIIKPFSEEQIEQYIKQYIQHQKPEWSLEQYQKAIEEMHGLKNLIKTPFLLKLAMEALPKMPQDKEQKYMTQAKLYDVFIEQWFIRQEQKLKLAKKLKEDEDIKPEFWNYAKRLAQLMHQQKTTLVTYDSSQSSNLFGETEESIWQKFFNADNPRIELLRTACLIREVGQHQYAFIHASLLEYFLTRDLYENLLSAKNEIPVIEVTPKISQPENKKQDYFNERLFVKETNTLQFLADRISEDEIFKKTLFERVYASRNNSRASIGASNALTILNRACVSFSGMDLSDIHAPHADLNGTIMSYTCLKGADLEEVTLTGAYLGNADFSKANLEKANFGEFPQLELNSLVKIINYSKDGRYLLVSSLPDIICFVKRNEKYEKHVHIKDAGSIFALNPDGKTLVSSGDEDKTLQLWDITSKKRLAKIKGHSAEITSIAFGPDGKMFASGSKDKIIRLWDFDNRSLLAELKGHTKDVNCVAISPDGSLLASGSNDKTICLWNTFSQKQVGIMSGHTKRIQTLAFSPDGKLLASGGWDKIVRLWDIVSQKLVAEMIGSEELIECVVFNPDGKILASGDTGNRIRLWDVISHKSLVEIIGHTGDVVALAFSPDSNILASGSNDHTVCFWNINIPETSSEINAHTSAIQTLSFSPDGRLLASGSSDRTVRLWDITSPKSYSAIKKSKNVIDSIAFSPSGKLLAVVSRRKGACLWDLSSQLLIEMKIDDSKVVSNIDFSPDGKFMAWGCSGYSIQLWDAASKVLLFNMKEKIPHREFTIVKFSPNGKILVSASGNKVQFWSFFNKSYQYEMNIDTNTITSLDFSKDGKMLALGCSGTSNIAVVRLYHVKTRFCIKELKGSYGNPIAVFNPDGIILACGSSDGLIYLWDVVNDRLLAEMRGHVGFVAGLAFSPDGKILASGGKDNAVILWAKVPVSYLQEEKWVMVSRFTNAPALLATNALFKGTTISLQNLKLLNKRGLKDYDGIITSYADAYSFIKSGTKKALRDKEMEAIKDYDEAIKLDPTDAEYFYLRGFSKAGLKNYSEAIKDYDEAIRLDPYHPKYFSGRGNLWVLLDNYAGAINNYDEVIKLNPNDMEASLNKAQCFERLARFSEAIDIYDKIFETDKKFSYQKSVLFYKGRALFYLNELTLALTLFNEILNDDIRYKHASCYKGYIFLLQNQIENADKLFADVKSLENNFYLAITGEALIAGMRSQLDLSLILIDQALSMLEDLDKRIEIYHIQGKVFAQLDFVDEARIAFEKALSLKSDYIPVLAELEKLPSTSFLGIPSSFWSLSREQVTTQQLPISEKDAESKSYTF
jgi:WD40 repeat protein/tetratricopeptide (TPR) repeat protein